MASRLVTTSFALVSAAALLTGCDTVSGWFGGDKSTESSGSSGYSSSTGSGAPAQSAYNEPTYGQGGNTAANNYASGGYDSSATANSRMHHWSGERVSSDKVKHAQQALQDEGLYKGSIDGIVGPQTRDAVSQYQRDHNLKQTAMLDRQTLRSLDASANGANRSDGSTKQQ